MPRIAPEKILFLKKLEDKPNKYDAAICCKTCSYALLTTDTESVYACGLHLVRENIDTPRYFPTSDYMFCVHHPWLEQIVHDILAAKADKEIEKGPWEQ